jgi:formyl-CoA transferase
VVYVSISGWGQWGPDHDRAGYDPLAQAASGFLSLNGSPDGPPVKTPTFLADDLGGVHGALAALAALRHRDRTGEGQHIDVSLLDSLLFQSTGYPTLAALGDPLPRMGNEFRIAAPANVYRALDGWVVAGAILDSQWQRLAALLGRPELAQHPDYATVLARVARRTELNAMLAEWVGTRTRAEVLRELEAADLFGASVRSYEEAATDAHVLARDMLQPVGAPGAGEVPIVGPAAKLSRTPTRVRSGAPALGAHTDAILTDLGYTEEDRLRLRRARAI